MPVRVVVVERRTGGLFAGVRRMPGLLRTWLTPERQGRSEKPVEGRRTRARQVLPGAAPAAPAPAVPETIWPFPLTQSAWQEGLAAWGARVAAPAVGVGVGARVGVGEHPNVEVAPSDAKALLHWLSREAEPRLESLFDLTVVDRWPGTPRFELVYRLRSAGTGAALVVRVCLDDEAGDGPTVDSVATLFDSADWLEREAAELFGIRFRGHPGLRRLLLDEAVDGAPLRRDFVSGDDASAGDSLAATPPSRSEGVR